MLRFIDLWYTFITFIKQWLTINYNYNYNAYLRIRSLEARSTYLEVHDTCIHVYIEVYIHVYI